jgi:1-deoxy-D-xylulose-5-phosphate reductoisomerase
MVDEERFPALSIAIEAGRRDDTTAAALSGADESAVEHFLAGRCSFTEIARLLDAALEAHTGATDPQLEDLLGAERWGRQFVDARIAAGVR